jgi:hypothetical protein
MIRAGKSDEVLLEYSVDVPEGEPPHTKVAGEPPPDRAEPPGTVNAAALLLAFGLPAFISALAYLPFCRSLGFYADDWFQNLQAHTNTLWFHVQTGRPGQSILLSLGYKILGDHILWWQLCAFGLSLASSLAALWLLRVIWPDRPSSTTCIAVLFAVFPGFSSHPVTLMYVHWYGGMTLAFLSIGIGLDGLDATSTGKKMLPTVLAVGLGLASWLCIEQFVALEAARIYLMWRRSAPGERARTRLTKLCRNALPYALAAAGYLIWRVAVLSPPRPTTNTGRILSYYRTHPGEEARRLLDRIIHACIDSVAAWAISPYQALNFEPTSLRALLTALALGLTAAAAFLVYSRQVSTKEGCRPVAGVLPLGVLFTIPLLTIPVLARFQIGLLSFGDRFFLGCALGSSMILFGVVSALSRPRYLTGLLSMVVLFSVTTQVLLGNAYRAHWQRYREAWWQLSWRAPQLQPGTLVLVDDRSFFLPSEREIWEEDIWGPVNQIYGAWRPQVDFAGQQFTLATAKALDRPESYPAPVDETFYSFKADVRRNIIITIPQKASCLHAIDGAAAELPADSSLTASQARYSQIERIVTNAPAHRPPADIFGAEPEHGWCYYFERADLARQKKDWDEVIRLMAEAGQRNLRPQDPTEWLPLAEAHRVRGEQ